jgi:predicted MPP superfamily phosphohydrolase
MSASKLQQLLASKKFYQCFYDDSVEAVILYPSLGMPMVLDKNQKKCSLIIATGADARAKFKIDGNDKYKRALEAYKYVARHLRLTTIDGCKPIMVLGKGASAKVNAREGQLYGDKGDFYILARLATRVWHLGTVKDGMLIHNRHGEFNKKGEREGSPIATLAPLLNTPDGPYRGWMTDLWEVELTLNSQLHAQIDSDEFLNWAWLVETTKAHKEAHKDNYFIINGDHHEPQDRMIDAYLRQLTDTDRKDERYRHFEHIRLHESTLAGELPDKYPMPEQGSYATRLQSWHPVIRATKFPLKIGHLSDIHVNVRQSALSKSQACIIEDVIKEPVGKKVAHTFFAVRELMKEMATKKSGVDTAFLLTGDYIDFNRNIDPDKVASGDKQIGAQWKQFNVLAEADKAGSKLYQRGFDDTLMYSLVREAYKKHKLPVFMVNGNHEAYQMPYGISPRTGLNPVRGFRDWMPKLMDLEKALKEANDPQKREKIRKELEAHRQEYEEASEWQNKRPNEGIPADHNLTVYEATLAYGPTYGQNWHALNFNAEQFDWFHTLFTPFANAALFLGAEPEKNGAGAKQILALLGWGGGEKFLETGDKFYETGNTVGKVTKDVGADQRGPGFLPYATQSLSPDQIRLLARAQSRKNTASPFIVASHFTVFNYDAGKTFYKDYKAGKTFPEQERGGFCPEDEPEEWGAKTFRELSAQYNKFNFGSCERGLATYFRGYVTQRDTNSSLVKRVDWHFSGHSHRAGVYAMWWEEEYVRCEGWDPGLRRGLATAGKDRGVMYPGTQFVVSSSAGPIGIQNLGEGFSGWLLRPPSGTLVNMETRRVCQILTKRETHNELPRLCVMLDYLHIMSQEWLSDLDAPLEFKSQEQYNRGVLRFDVPVTITVSAPVHTFECLNMEALYVWVFKHEGVDEESKKPFGSWKKVKPEVRAHLKGKGKYTLCFTGQAGTDLAKALGHKAGNKLSCHAIAAFCGIPLVFPKEKKGDNTAEAGWAKDLMKLDDWLFPIELGMIRYDRGDGDMGDLLSFDRPKGERGEVPNWKFLADYFSHKGYIPAKEAIKQQENSDGGDTKSENPYKT